MAHLAKYVKAATDRKRYQIDYTEWLDTGEGVVGVIFTIPDNSIVTPLVVDGIAVLPTALGVQYYVSGGVDGTTYEILTNLTTTIGPQLKEDSVLVSIREP